MPARVRRARPALRVSASLLQARAVLDAGAALVGEVGLLAGGGEAAEVTEQQQHDEGGELEVACGEQGRGPAHE